MQRLTTKEKKEIGWRIKEIRERDLEMTQTEFAKNVGTTSDHLKRIEKGAVHFYRGYDSRLLIYLKKHRSDFRHFEGRFAG